MRNNTSSRQGIFNSFSVLLPLFLIFADAFAQSDAKTDLSEGLPSESFNYLNYVPKGSYENSFYVGEVPEWHYYDLFGNKLVDGFYLYGMSMNRNSAGTGLSNITLHPFLQKWMNGIVQVGDINDQGGILALIGDAIKTRFTPYSFNQSYFSGTRFDILSNWLGGMNLASIIASRISNAGVYAGFESSINPSFDGDWLHGIQLLKKYKDLFEIGGTYVNLHHEDSRVWSGNPFFNGVNSDSSSDREPTALAVYGLDGRCNLPAPKLTLYGEYKQSQEVLDGHFRPRTGTAANLSGIWDFLDRGRIGSEGYIVESRFKTTFFCPAHKDGEPNGIGRYMYSLVENNDDRDEYPENGQSKLLALPVGDPDGVIPLKFDRNKNGIYDWEEDFLSYDCDPPKSNVYFDRNNNGTADEIEFDAYPDYRYVPSYYLPGERYLRYDDMDKKEETFTSKDDGFDSQASKGLLGMHFYGRFGVLPKLDLTCGALVEKSQENSYQNIYEDSTLVGQIYAPEKASTYYFRFDYKNDLGVSQNLTIQNNLRIINDNIPNHTQSFSISQAQGLVYQTVVDSLDFRDALNDMFVAQYSLFKNRGFNFTSRAKYEFTKQNAHLEYNYPDETIQSLILVNKAHYIYLLPFLKDMFFIPKFKNIYEYDFYGPRVNRLDAKYLNHNMANILDLVFEWKFTEKTSVTLGAQGKGFNDFSLPDSTQGGGLKDIFSSGENYFMDNFSVQVMMKDRFSGLNVFLTSGISRFNYFFYNDSPGTINHNPLNNPHRAIGNIASYEMFIKVHGGF